MIPDDDAEQRLRTNFSYTTNFFFSALLQTQQLQGLQSDRIPLYGSRFIPTNSLDDHFAAVGRFQVSG